jgi:protein with PEP-CTERM/exosortase system signal
MKKTILVVLAVGTLSCALFNQQAQAGQITGEIHFGGDVRFDSLLLSNANQVNIWISAQNTLLQTTVLSTDGDLVVPFGTLAGMADPWIFASSMPTPGVWNIPLFGMSFDLESVTSVGRVGNSFLNILAKGTIHAAGFDDTPGMFSFTVSNPDGKPHRTFAFAAETIAVPTPDGGATVMLLGAALAALGMARRFLKS